MLTDFLVPPEQGQFNDGNDKAVSNPCPNCNLGYSFQIQLLRPFSSLLVRGISFMFFPPIQCESCMRAQMLVLAKLHLCVTGFLV